MNTIKQLIDKYCPDGVEYKKLGEIADIGTGSQDRKDAVDNGMYPFYVRSKDVLRIDKYLFDEEAIIIPGEGGIGDIFHYVKGKYGLHQRAYRVHLSDTSILTKYLYYYFSSSFKKFIFNKAVSATVTSIRKPMLEKFEVPVPPIPVQREIVRILDSFTSLEAELEAELEARRKQYEYYRDQLLSFKHLSGEATDEVEWKTIKDVCLSICSGGTPNTQNKDFYNGNIPWLPWLRTQEVDWKDIYKTDVLITEAGLKNSSAKLIPANCVIVAMYGATAAKVAINKIPLTTNQACCNLQIDESICNNRYVYQWLCKNYEVLPSPHSPLSAASSPSSTASSPWSTTSPPAYQQR